MSFMNMRLTPPEPRASSWTDAARPLSDLGSQLEDLITHVMRCERWAQFDDRLDLAFAVQRVASPARGR